MKKWIVLAAVVTVAAVAGWIVSSIARLPDFECDE